MKSFHFKIILPAVLSIVLLCWTIFSFLLPTFEETLIARKKQLLQEVVNTAHSILGEYQEREDSGELSREEAQLRAKKRISHMRYGDELKDYFWINTMEPKMVMHPYRPELVGESLINYKDSQGKLIFVEAAAIVSKQGGGFIDYMWQWKDDPERIVPKVSYAKGFEPWGWIIGSGIYVEDVHAEISSITRGLYIILTGILFLTALLTAFIIWQGIKTERLKLAVEKKLKTSEKKYRELVQNANSIILRMDKKGNILFFNEFAQVFFGFSEQEMIGRNVVGTIVSEISSAGQNLKTEILDLCAKPHLYVTNEFENIKKTGERVWIAWTNKAVLDETGVVKELLCVGNDITESKKSENALREAILKLKETVKAANVGLWDWDLISNKVSYSSEWKRQIGYEEHEIDEDIEEWKNHVHPDDLDQTLENIQHCFDEKCQDFLAEFRFRHKDGSYRWVLSQGSILHDETCRPIRMLGSHIDITDRKHNEVKLLESEDFLNRTGNMAKVGGWQVDLEAKKVMFTKMTRMIHELPDNYEPDLDEAINFYHPDDREIVRESVKQVIETGKSFEIEVRLITAKGRQRWVRSHGQSIFEGGKCVRLSGTFQDITDQRIIQQEAMRTARLASIGEIAAGVAHEVNNPLNGIINCAELLKDILSEKSLDTKWADAIIKESQRIAKIIKSLLSYVRPRNEKKELFMIKNILDEIIFLMQKTFDTNSVTLSVEISEHLSRVHVQPQKIQEVFINIMINALYAMNQKYGSESNKKRLEIKTETVKSENKEYVRIVFTDNGAGIPQESLNRICEPFYSLKPAGKGSGLGLNICYNIIKDHAGKLLFESKEGQYTRVMVDLLTVQN